MWVACSGGYLEVAEVLIEAGADVNKTDLLVSVVCYANRQVVLIYSLRMGKGLCGKRATMVTLKLSNY